MFRLTRAVREYFRYTGISADMEKRGLGCSRPALAWANRAGVAGAPARAGTGAPANPAKSADQTQHSATQKLP